MLSRMRTRRRITVTLPEDLLAHARAASGRHLSAYVEKVLRAQQLRDEAPAVRAWRKSRAEADAEELTDVFGEDVA